LSTGRFISTTATDTVLRLTNICITLTATTAVLRGKKKKENKGRKKKRTKKNGKQEKMTLFIYISTLMTYNTRVPRAWH
jgi:hypothetical protein